MSAVSDSDWRHGRPRVRRLVRHALKNSGFPGYTLVLTCGHVETSRALPGRKECSHCAHTASDPLKPWQISYIRRAVKLRRKLSYKCLAAKFDRSQTTIHKLGRP